MSDKLPQTNQNDEVDIIQLFRYIGKSFSKLFGFFGNLFSRLYSVLIYALKPLVVHFKIIAIVVMTAAILGYIVDKYKSPVYTSEMLVKPYYDSKYQLANNVNYFNALISSQNYRELSTIFEIDSTTSAKELLGFSIEIGPETQNDLLKEYDEYIKSLDSTLAFEVTYDDFIENRDILAGNIFSIKAKSTSNNIFPTLEKGFVKTFKNQYSVDLKKRMDSVRNVKKQNYLSQLDRIEKLQETYLEIKKSESDKGEAAIALSSSIPLMQEKTKTNEFELFKEELDIRKALRLLEEEEITEGVYFDILSGFEVVGTQESNIEDKYLLILPLMAFVIMILGFMMFKLFKYINDYE